MRLILGLFSLVEIMRVISTIGLTDEAEKMRTSKRDTIVAGRYFASRSKADTSKASFGIEDIDAMQQSMDEDYPNTYHLFVYKVENDKTYRQLFNGNQQATKRVPITLVCVSNPSTNSIDYFGYVSNHGNLQTLLDSFSNSSSL